MTRVKGGTASKAKHKKVLKLAKGYWQSRSTQFKKANEAVLHAGNYAFAGRKLRKRDIRRLWIQRINAGLTPHDINYSSFIHKLKENNIELDRKVLAQLALDYPKAFEAVVTKVK